MSRPFACNKYFAHPIFVVQSLFPVMEEALYPMLSRLMSTDGQDMIEEVRC